MAKVSKGIFGIIILVVVALILIFAFRNEIIYPPAYTTTVKPTELTVKNGSQIEIYYVLSLENGDIVERTNTPIKFTVGNGSVIKGLEEAVIGMKLNEEKNLSIPAEKAYGLLDYNKIQIVPKIQESRRIQRSLITKFEQEIGTKPVVNMTYYPPKLQWPIFVLEVGDMRVVYRYDPEPNSTIDTVFGKAIVNVTDTQIQIILPEIPLSSLIYTPSGIGRIININSTDVVVDFNKEFAGKSLNLFVRIEAINNSVY